MTTAEIEALAYRLSPVHEQIKAYDAARPLNEHARVLVGAEGALQILWTEASELAEVRQQYDPIPLEQLNGGRKKVAAELGDTVFGLAEYFRLRGGGEFGRKELTMLGGVVGWMIETEQKYNLNMTTCGIEVNRGKNVQNNPAMFYTDHHPLDPAAVTVEKNGLVRRGLRSIRNLHPDGIINSR